MKKHIFVLTLLLFFLIPACNAREMKQSNLISERSYVEPDSSSSENTAPIPNTSADSAPEESCSDSGSDSAFSPIVDADEFPGLGTDLLTFPQYDPDAALSGSEYFSTERFLNSYELNGLGLIRQDTFGAMGDMPGYRYVKGWDESDEAFAYVPDPWRVPYDNLYLLCEKTGERLLLAELSGIRKLYVFMDCLYLTTDNAVWRCGRLGENLICVYEHPTRIYPNPANRSQECFYFVAEGEPWKQRDEAVKKPGSMFPDSDTVIWRLYLPTGQADRICVIEDLPHFDWELGEQDGYRPISSHAVLITDYSCDTEYFVYSAQTGKMSAFSEADGAKKVSFWDAWVRKYYPLNQY